MIKYSPSETEYERMIIDHAVNLGWKYKNNVDINALRKTEPAEVLLIDEIKKFLITSQNLNDNQISEVIRKLKDLKGSALEEANKLFTKYFIEGIKIKDKKKKKFITVKLHKKTNNRLIVTNQFSMYSTHPEYNIQIPDIVLYINGLPVTVIELKKPGQPGISAIENAYQQIENYKNYLKNLFVFNICNIISDGDISKVGSLTSSLSRYFNWRGKIFSASPSNIFKDLIKPTNLIELATNFTFYTSEHINSKKIIGGYHQFYGVKKAKNAILKAMEGDKKAGIFWHTQGAGKSYSMIFLTKIISILRPRTTFIVVTDRNNLDDQLHHNFMLAKDYIGQKIKKIATIQNLKQELKNHQQDGIFFSTIQKFTADVGKLIDRDNVVVISDEAHRSHNNIDGKYEINYEDRTYLKKFGSAKYLRDAFPNATFIGFTGTPIEKTDKSTQRIFGKIISIYTMSEAERDGVIVEINYESRKASIHFDEEKLKLLDKVDVEINKKLEKHSILPGEVKKKINKAVKSLNNFISDSNRIHGVCEDFLKHYNSRKNLVAGKAMIVTLNRNVALKYYKKIIELAPHLKKHIRLVFTANGQNDLPEMIKLAGTSQSRKEIGEDFKREDSYLKIVIVVDMWLTGFDVPVLDTLYLDKPLKMHNLIQAIARTNRVYTNKQKGIIKESGLIVDYIGIWKRLREALAFYANKKGIEIEADHNIQVFKVQSLENLELIYENFGINKLNIDIEKCLKNNNYSFESIEKITNLVLFKKQQNKFVDYSRVVAPIFKKIISILTDMEKIKFYLILASRQRLIKIALDDVDFIGMKNEMLYHLDNALEFSKTVVIDKFKNKNINLNDLINFFEKNINNKKTDLSARENISVLKLIIENLKKIDIIRASKLSNDLRTLLKRYDNNFITMEDLIKGIKILKNEAIISINNNEDDGLTQAERNFYKIIAEPVKQTDYDQMKIKTILEELLIIINNEDLVNKQWVYIPLLRRKTKAHIKKLLKKHNYPPEKTEFTREKIIEALLYYKEIENE